MNILHKIVRPRTVIALTICIVIASCSSSADPDEQEKIDHIESVLDESIKFHDEVMPLMSEMGSLRIQILQRLDSSAADTLNKSHYLEVANALKTSSDAMMEWMKNFSKPPRAEDLQNYEASELDSILNVQKDQLEDIDRINQKMKQAVADGRQLVPKK